MAHDLIKGRTLRDWACHGAASDLPQAARGYVPTTYWGPAEMEAEIARLMSKPKGTWGLGSKPTRQEAIAMLADQMKAKRIGPRDVQAGIGSEVGSLLVAAKTKEQMLNKVDDVRYDVRRAGALVSGATFALAGAVALLGISGIFRAGAKKKGKG